LHRQAPPCRSPANSTNEHLYKHATRAEIREREVGSSTTPSRFCDQISAASSFTVPETCTCIQAKGHQQISFFTPPPLQEPNQQPGRCNIAHEGGCDHLPPRCYLPTPSCGKEAQDSTRQDIQKASTGGMEGHTRTCCQQEEARQCMADCNRIRERKGAGLGLHPIHPIPSIHTTL
jgi:hypothetical protein